MSGLRPKTRRFTFDLSDLGFVYSLLCALTLVAINPWGNPRGEVWTDPKVYALIGLALLTWGVLLVVLLQFIVQRVRRLRTTPGGDTWAAPRFWWPVALLFGAFLATGLATAYYTPIKFSNAFAAHDEMGDGWLYWAWLAAFVLGNALLLRRFPRLFRAQLTGFLIGGGLMALATLPQYVNWRLDYTQMMGREVSTPNPRALNYLASSIYQGQMPIGLTSHRGHAAFVVAATAILALVSLLRGWLRGRYAWPLYALSLVAVYLTSTRGAQLAFGVGLIYLLVRFWRVGGGARRVVLIAFVPLALGGAAVLGSAALGVSSGTRALPSWQTLLKRPDSFFSLRTDYWRIAAAGIAQRPVLGWGYNGFGLAFAYANDFDRRFKIFLATENKKPVPIAQLQATDHYWFRYFGPDNTFYRGRVMSNKAHNSILDMTLSVGLVGVTFYLLLLAVLLAATVRGAGWGLEAVVVVYLVYGLTWFDAAQFTHLAWWVLSAGLALQRLPQRTPAAQVAVWPLTPEAR